MVSNGSIKAYYNNVLQATIPKSFSGGYFKAGVYTQANCTNSSPCDTSNYGDHSGPGERKAAEYVAEKLAEVGLEPQIFESHPGRASTVARIAGEDPSRPALLIHGRVERLDGAVSLLATRLRRLRVVAAARSRDFR